MSESSSFSALKRLSREFRPYKRKAIVVVVLGLVISVVQPYSLYLVKRVTDELKVGELSPFFKWMPFALVAVFVTSGLSKYFYNAFRRYISERVVAKFRTQLFEKFCRMSLSFVDRKRSGEMLSYMQNDLQQVNSGIETICDILKEPFTFLALILSAFYFDSTLTLCTLIVIPLVGLLFSWSGAAVKRYSAKNLEQFSDLSSLAQESLVGTRVVKVFRLEDLLIQKFEAIHDKYFKTIWKSIKVQEIGTPAVELIGAVLMAGVITYGAYRVSEGLMTAGDMIAFLGAIGMAQMPIKKLQNSYLKLKIGEAAAERIYALLDGKDTKEKLTGSARVYRFEHSIKYENVSLSYGDRLALNDISFEVKRGECIALVGHSGGGKSSIVNLLPRLYETTGGSIKIDGVDIRDIYLSDLRGLISFVTQDTFLFHDTIYENIRFGRPNATQKDVERAAELAHCTDFIARSPNGFDTLIGDRGVCLSGGERQRVAIARALLKGAPILVLDEATSSLDSKSEAIVQSALDELVKDRTTLMVAHRFSTVRRAQKIFVLDQGKILEQGTHSELMANDGTYSLLFQHQYDWEKATSSVLQEPGVC